mgnify:CR=1 FL=1
MEQLVDRLHLGFHRRWRLVAEMHPTLGVHPALDDLGAVEIAAVDQSRDALDDEKTVWEEISDGLDIIKVGNYETSSRAYVGRFNFRGQDQQKKIGLLSGGERNRVHLAKTLKAGGNLLLLDEPTNDLDVETLRALEEALLEFPGSAIVISHDRWFLDRIATHILAFEGNSEVVWFAGNYADYEQDRKRRLGAHEQAVDGHDQQCQGEITDSAKPFRYHWRSPPFTRYKPTRNIRINSA